MSQNQKPNFKNSSLIKLIPLALSSWILFGCAGTATTSASVCTDKLANAESLVAKKDYYRSLEVLESLLSDCRGTGLMERSQFLLSESRFNLEDWIEARGEYSTFVLNFPSSPFAETASFRKAISAYNMSYTDMRDDSPTQTAQRDMQDFIENYPNSALLDSARTIMNALHNRLGEKDFQTAMLYWRMNEPLACAMYLKSFLNEYPSSDRRFEALAQIIDAYIVLEQFEPAERYLRLMGDQFPQAKKERESRLSDLESAKIKFEKRMQDELIQKQYKKEDAK